MTEPLKNLLFVMCDQLRWDHLSCNGHPTIRTPNLDALAGRGTRFDQAYVQAGVCGPSRMSFYTGRYVGAHGVTWNRVPLSPTQPTLGDYLQGAGRTLHLIGKSHVTPDVAGLRRLGVPEGSPAWRHFAAGGFSEIDRIDGHAEPGPESGYGAYLRRNGYGGARPWSEHVISADGGEAAEGLERDAPNGWFLRNVHLPARVREEHSETAYVTHCALDFLRDRGDQPFALHLSYVKPHWPYLAPAPYHAAYRTADMLAVRKHPVELERPHPVLAAYQRMEESITFARDEVVRRVRPAYMGLIEHVDHHIGRVLQALADNGQLEQTLIVFTADHGDFGGDHHLGEKDLFHDQVTRVPLFVVDPRRDADATRGQRITQFVEAVDLVPTMLQALGVTPAIDRTQGRSLMPLLGGVTPAGWRDAVFSEIDYSFRQARVLLGRSPHECRGWMVRTARWKYVHWQGYRPQLFDLESDPDEFHDRGDDPAYAPVCAPLQDRLWAWTSSLHPRLNMADAEVAQRTHKAREHGIFYATW